MIDISWLAIQDRPNRRNLVVLELGAESRNHTVSNNLLYPIILLLQSLKKNFGQKSDKPKCLFHYYVLAMT